MPLTPRSFRTRLLAWYGAYARDLPWRASRDPYRVWVSEIMLQQTRVAAVIEHYREFLRRFSTVQKLARAREASVLAAWSGLGYYRRARMLHAAAKLIVKNLGGEFPKTAEAWLALPGIGRYTSSAIASIAFDEPVAVVDGNVERVLHRVTGQRLTGEKLWKEAQGLLDCNRPGDFNQALMELGATVCTPRAPACLTCPVVEFCTTRGEMREMAKAAPQKKRQMDYALDCREGSVFLVQRPHDASLMPRMWELPQISPPRDHARPAFTVRHSITVTDYTVRVWRHPERQGKERNNGALRDFSGRRIALSRLPKLPMTGLTRKILRRAEII